ncbi:hypothetical protein TTHERM_00433550 (macronuclear) [Tetrahymena thermophila SB210]|uniref:Uncharacterized protein n=1 Tax=Tetrahymena thermophila (strain SB210) TaxID=312017 RepID=Q231A3_TETTS|nr:hypothetical protein TTHERM_00433550 [Tetrahymena thermophila SB210]EAR91136.1 hypothetical protein TTHERM_00433550 [Tetrahymena thermophila SB210]|eukprot:XP_001011381.1 hypothetical protein TTHERM_00433550 [Tetrahymena thermophila SB210]
MQLSNFQDDLIQNEHSNIRVPSIIKSQISNKNSSICLTYTAISQNNSSNIQQLQMNQSVSDQQQYRLQLSANIKGLIIQLDEEELIELKEKIINKIKNTLKLDNFKYELKFPQIQAKALANGLMNLRDEQVKKDVDQWLNQNIFSKVYQEERNNQLHINKYDYIRYFYFKNSESFKKNKPDVDYGQKIVKYKNQITVLIGIIENFLNQPLQYFKIFEQFKQQYDKFQSSNLAQEIQGDHVQELMNYLLYLTKLRLDQNQSPNITFEVNQKLYLYLNSKNEPLEVMMKFIKYLLQTHKITYQQEDMEIFWRAFKVSVISYFESESLQTGNSQQQEMQLSIVFENIRSDKYDFLNAYLLYDSMFQDSFRSIPLKCLNCKIDNLTSINYVKPLSNEGRLCYKCCQQ